MIISTNNVTFEEVQSETLVVGIPKHPENTEKWDALLNVYGNHILDWVKSGDISSDSKKIVKVPIAGQETVKRILFVGLGDRKKLTQENIREAFGLVGKELLSSKPESLAVWVPSFTSESATEADVAYLAGEGIGMGAFVYEGYKTTSNVPDYYLPAIELLTDTDLEEAATYFEVGSIYADAVNEARILVNTPGNVLTSTQLGEYARELGETYGFETEILGKKEIEELGMGALLAVNQGSVEEPRLIALKYQATDNWDDVVALVGKGITFDTGGYSIKTKTGIVGMKGDMGGAAAVLGAMQIIGELRPNKNVIAVIA
ncbi:MAG: M17 family peptidase N-terminal domain-containing protein, partial [Psychrobacillus sp.]